MRGTLIQLPAKFLLFQRPTSPGRFFVATELKLMFAHLLLNYDVKMANGQGRPANRVFGSSSRPDVKAEVMFRQRREDRSDLD